MWLFALACAGCTWVGGETSTALPAPSRLDDVDGWQQFTKQTSVDEATRQFRRVAGRHAPSQRFEARYERSLAAIERGARAPAAMRCYRLILVPGWRYRSSTEHGADLAAVVALAGRLGMAHERVDTDEEGVVEWNAALVASRLRNPPSRVPIIVLSVSKGSAETALALSHVLADRTSPATISAWINVNGLLGGTPLADTLVTGPGRIVMAGLLKLAGGTPEEVESITTSARRAAPDVPTRAGPLFVTLQAAPLSAEVTRPARAGFLYLSQFGPNDGITLLADAVIEGGVNLMWPGTDHFLEVPDRNARIEALLRATVEALGAPRGCAG